MRQRKNQLECTIGRLDAIPVSSKKQQCTSKVPGQSVCSAHPDTWKLVKWR